MEAAEKIEYSLATSYSVVDRLCQGENVMVSASFHIRNGRMYYFGKTVEFVIDHALDIEDDGTDIVLTTTDIDKIIKHDSTSRDRMTVEKLYTSSSTETTSGKISTMNLVLTKGEGTSRRAITIPCISTTEKRSQEYTGIGMEEMEELHPLVSRNMIFLNMAREAFGAGSVMASDDTLAVLASSPTRTQIMLAWTEGGISPIDIKSLQPVITTIVNEGGRFAVRDGKLYVHIPENGKRSAIRMTCRVSPPRSIDYLKSYIEDIIAGKYDGDRTIQIRESDFLNTATAIRTLDLTGNLATYSAGGDVLEIGIIDGHQRKYLETVPLAVPFNGSITFEGDVITPEIINFLREGSITKGKKARKPEDDEPKPDPIIELTFSVNTGRKVILLRRNPLSDPDLRRVLFMGVY